MPLSELLPLVKELSHTDRLLLLHFLTSELIKDASLIPLGDRDKISIPNLHDSFEAAAVLAEALAQEKAAIHG